MLTRHLPLRMGISQALLLCDSHGMHLSQTKQGGTRPPRGSPACPTSPSQPESPQPHWRNPIAISMMITPSFTSPDVRCPNRKAPKVGVPKKSLPPSSFIRTPAPSKGDPVNNRYPGTSNEDCLLPPVTDRGSPRTEPVSPAGGTGCQCRADAVVNRTRSAPWRRSGLFALIRRPCGQLSNKN